MSGELRTGRGRRMGWPGPRLLGAMLAATAANDFLGFRTAMNNGQGRARGRGHERVRMPA
jgi:hypothetical protein